MTQSNWDELASGAGKPPEELSSILTKFAIADKDSGLDLQGTFLSYLDKERGKGGLRGTTLLDSTWDDDF